MYAVEARRAERGSRSVLMPGKRLDCGLQPQSDLSRQPDDGTCFHGIECD